ncbi:MAG: hypothetical protein M1827_001625 [Pycnora praestabilis]|nr:MAG: hypothetical protein M1827_001625 [Pycnora praestabilis]
MHAFILGPLWALAALVLYKIISVLLTNRRDAAEAERLGCKPEPAFPNKLPLGIDVLRRIQKADREQLFPDDAIKRYEEMNCAATWSHTVLGTKQIITVDPKNLQAMLATQFNDFGLGERRASCFAPLFGNGIFTLDGKGWEHSRAMMRPQFARDQVSDLDLEERHVQNMMEALPADGKGWTTQLDLLPIFFRLTLDSATEFLFGESVESQLADLPGHQSGTLQDPSRDEKAFAFGFDNGQKWLSRRVRLQDKYWMLDSFEFRDSCKKVHAFADYFVNKALRPTANEKELEKGEDKEKYIFLEALVAQTKDPIELRSQLLNILLAGRDTTASLLGWLFYLLVRHPTVFKKLRSAILEEFGTYQDSEECTFSKLKGCQYLQYCINETLRLYPVVPMNGRQALKNTTLPRGGGPSGQSPIFVRKGSEVGYSVHVMHRRKDLWGEDADEFKPERWVGRKTDWSYLPFNGGPRVCLGQQFALTEASYVTVRLLQRFDSMESWETETITLSNLTLTSCPGNGVKVKLHEAVEKA